MLKFFNTLSGKKEVLRPRKGKKITLFVCGLTTYDFAHLGHARTYIVFDLIAKYLRQKGYNVYYLQNITDIDDKIINRAKREKVSWKKLSRKFEKEYLKDIKLLKIDSVTKYAPATEHIKEIISQVKRLLEKGFAYKISDGIYYDISKFKDYGKLSQRTVLQAEDAVSRIDETKEKRNKGDFCLWKYRKRKERSEYEPFWPSPFGDGRPGWHIEDTAITEKYFGPQYDIHGGARDLIFPHHEAEISQMEAISGKKPMVKYWLHSGFLTIKGRKMSKSLANFITIRDFLKKYPVPYGPRLLRLFVLKTHYRSPIDYTEKGIEQTKKELAKIDEFVYKIQNTKIKSQNGNLKFKILKFQNNFQKAMDDDLNTPLALASVFSLINQANSLLAEDKLSRAEAKKILAFLKKVDEIFSFIFWKKPKEKIPKEIWQLIKKREKYRQKGDWQKADEIRKKIKEMDYLIEDTKKGPKLKTKDIK